MRCGRAKIHCWECPATAIFKMLDSVGRYFCGISVLYVKLRRQYSFTFPNPRYDQKNVKSRKYSSSSEHGNLLSSLSSDLKAAVQLDRSSLWASEISNTIMEPKQGKHQTPNTAFSWLPFNCGRLQSHPKSFILQSLIKMGPQTFYQVFEN